MTLAPFVGYKSAVIGKKGSGPCVVIPDSIGPHLTMDSRLRENDRPANAYSSLLFSMPATYNIFLFHPDFLRRSHPPPTCPDSGLNWKKREIIVSISGLLNSGGLLDNHA
jgi:hypothetical protein